MHYNMAKNSLNRAQMHVIQEKSADYTGLFLCEKFRGRIKKIHYQRESTAVFIFKKKKYEENELFPLVRRK